MKKLLGFLCLFLVSSVASASSTTVQGIDLDFVTIGNAGNAADDRGYGAVDYEYQIGMYEITVKQWSKISSAAGIYKNGYWSGNQAAGDMSWYEAVQFCNYLTSGDKYAGAYKFDASGVFIGIDRDAALSVYKDIYVLPTEDEWYKAAYYTGSGYSKYANGLNTPPIAGLEANYDRQMYNPWNVGSGAVEQNGTYDMMGNVLEWNETILTGRFRCIRGGYFINDKYYSTSSVRTTYQAQNYDCGIGFRIATFSADTSVVPAPGAVLLAGFGTSIIGILRRKLS